MHFSMFYIKINFRKNTQQCSDSFKFQFMLLYMWCNVTKILPIICLNIYCWDWSTDSTFHCKTHRLCELFLLRDSIVLKLLGTHFESCIHCSWCNFIYRDTSRESLLVHYDFMRVLRLYYSGYLWFVTRFSHLFLLKLQGKSSFYSIHYYLKNKEISKPC